MYVKYMKLKDGGVLHRVEFRYDDPEINSDKPLIELLFDDNDNDVVYIFINGQKIFETHEDRCSSNTDMIRPITNYFGATLVHGDICSDDYGYIYKEE